MNSLKENNYVTSKAGSWSYIYILYMYIYLQDLRWDVCRQPKNVWIRPQNLRATTFPTFSLFLSADSSSILPLLTCHLNSKAEKILSFAYTRSPWLDLLFAMQPYIFQTASMHHLISEPDSDVVQMKQLSHPSCQSFDHHLFETIASMAMQGRVQGIKV